jgi:ketosteroid isomerase-like protein
MKNHWMYCALAVLALGVSGASQAQQAGDTEKAIAALENQWLKSTQTNNADLAAPLLADKLASTDAEGKLSNKAQSLADAKSRKFTSAEYDNVQVTVYGDTAIATGIYKGKGTESNGKTFDENERFTDTWVKMPNGKWQCVATQTTAVKM